MKTVYLHIGYGKTGTSSVQTFLSKNRTKLAELGLLYPETGLVFDAHHGLAIFQEPEMSAGIQGLYKNLIREIEESPANRVIISSEQFCFIRPPYLEKVKYFFKNHEVRIIFYIRKQSQLIESAFLQWQKEGRNYGKNLEDFYNTNKAGFDFMQRIQPWIDAFGSKNIIVRVYDRRLIGDDTCSDILRILGIENSLPAENTNENLSLLPEFSKLLSIIDGKISHSDQRQAIINELLELTIKFKPLSKSKLTSPSLEAQIAEYYKNSNSELTLKLLQPKESEIFLES